MTVRRNVVWQDSEGRMSLQVNKTGIWLVCKPKTQREKIILLEQYPDALVNAVYKILDYEDNVSALLDKVPNIVAVSLSLKGNVEDRWIELEFMATGNIHWQHKITFSEAYEFLITLNNHW